MEHGGFLNSSPTVVRQYSDLHMAKILSLLAGGTEGYIVGFGDELLVEEGAGLEVMVNTGAALLGCDYPGWWYINDSAMSLSIESEVAGYSRIDRIVLCLNRLPEVLEVCVQVKKGVAVASGPVAPALSDSLTVHEMALAQVNVTGGSADITVSDERRPVIYSQSLTVEKTASWTLGFSDMHKFIRATHATGLTVTVPANAAVPLPINTEIVITQHGEGAVTISPASGVYVRSLDGNLKSDGRYSGFALRKIGTNEWYAMGALTSS